MKKKIELNKETIEVDIILQTETSIEFRFEGEIFKFDLKDKKENQLMLSSNHEQASSHVFNDMVFTLGRESKIKFPETASRRKNKEGAGLVSPMPGKIFKILKSQGEVKAQETILILEAMKMEHAIKAPKDGKIKRILFKEGELVQANVELVEMEA